MTPLIVLEVPHQSPAKSWIAWDGEADVIAAARNIESRYYAAVTTYDLLDLYYPDTPPEAATSAMVGGVVVEINGEWFAPADAPSEYDWAEETLFHDLHLGRVFASVEEVEAYNSAHQYFKARAALDASLEEVREFWA